MTAVVSDADFVNNVIDDPNLQFKLPFPKPSTTKLINHDLSMRFTRAQEAAAAVVHTARWIRLYNSLDDNKKAALLSASDPDSGAHRGFSVVAGKNWQVDPLDFREALAWSLPGVTPPSWQPLVGCTCKCGAVIDDNGDHALHCSHFNFLRKQGMHNLIQEPFRYMGRLAFGPDSVSKDDTRTRAHSLPYSPLYRPDTTFTHASETGNHLVADVTNPSATTTTALPAARRQPGAAAKAAAAGKRAKYGDLGAHKMLPLVVEAQGAWGKDAKWFFNYCKQRVAVDDYDAAGLPRDHHTWTTSNFTNYFLTDISLQRIRGLAYLLRSAAAVLRFTDGVLPPAHDDNHNDYNADLQDHDLAGRGY